MLHFLQIFAWIGTFSAAVCQAGASGRQFSQRNANTGIGPEISFLNVDKVWQETNITGKNVVVAVLDDRINYWHEDLRRNYNQTLSYDFVDDDTYPLSSSSHGTKCAGIIAAKHGGKCRTGIAYNAQLAGVRIFGESSSSKDRTADGLGYNKENIDIYSNSWGPKDNGHSTNGLDVNGTMALKYGASKGRNGLGSIFVFSSGNGGFFGDSCAFDGYVNSIYTIAIGGVTKTGEIPGYAEPCSSIIASTYGDEVKTSDVFNRCNSRFGKTSGAAAFASGIVALLLEANNKLTWRDVQHLIIRTSNPRKTKIDGNDWTVNGAGLMVHPSVGFGVMDAKKLVDVAQQWVNVPEQIRCTVKLDRRNVTIKRNGTRVSFPLPKRCSDIKTLEHVQVYMTLSFSPRAFLLMDLISPAQTKSQLLYQRIFDAITQRKDYRRLKVTSLHFWGENPTADNGNWTVLLKSAKFIRPAQVKLLEFTITFYGTTEDPISKNTIILPSGNISCPQQGGKIFWKGYGSKCCGASWTYDPNYERCCNGTSKIVEKSPLCGRTTYNKCKKICCDRKLLDITRDREEMTCCGTMKYSKKENVCCGGEIYAKSSCRKKWIYTHYRWGRYRYISHEAKCSNGRRIAHVPIYPYKWCQRTSIAKQTENVLYCGGLKYNKTEQLCCGGKISNKTSCKMSRYSGNWYIHEARCSYYQRLTHVVKSSYTRCTQPSITKQREDVFYCGAVKYNKAKQLCCGEKIYDKTSCRTQPNWRNWYIHGARCSYDQHVTHVLKRPSNICSQPSPKPSLKPSLKPSFKPSLKPSLNPSPKPSPKPSLKPSPKPSLKPSITEQREEDVLYCGRVKYSTTGLLCCGGKISAKTSCKVPWRWWNRYIHEAKCSNDQILTHVLKSPYTICNEHSVIKQEKEFCGEVMYNEAKQVCCSRKIYAKSSCESNWLYKNYGWRQDWYFHQARCSYDGTITHDLIYPSKTCQPSIAKRKEDMVYCGSGKYSKTKQGCCGRGIYEKTSCMSRKTWVRESIYRWGQLFYRRRQLVVWYVEEASCSNGQITYVQMYDKTCNPSK